MGAASQEARHFRPEVSADGTLVTSDRPQPDALYVDSTGSYQKTKSHFFAHAQIFGSPKFYIFIS